MIAVARQAGFPAELGQPPHRGDLRLAEQFGDRAVKARLRVIALAVKQEIRRGQQRDQRGARKLHRVENHAFTDARQRRFPSRIRREVQLVYHFRVVDRIVVPVCGPVARGLRERLGLRRRQPVGTDMAAGEKQPDVGGNAAPERGDIRPVHRPPVLGGAGDQRIVRVERLQIAVHAV